MKRLKLNTQLFAEGEAINMGVLRVDAEMNATKFKEGVKQVEQQLDSLSSSVDKSFSKLSQPYKTEGGRLNGLKIAITNVKNAYDTLSKSAQKLGDNAKIKSKGFESSLKNILDTSKTKLSSLGAGDYMGIKDPKQLSSILKQYQSDYNSLRKTFTKEIYNQANAYDRLEEKEQANYDKEMARLEKEMQKIQQAAEAEEYRQSVLQRFKNIGSSGLANTFFQKAYAESIAQVTDETVKEAVETRIFNSVLAEEEQKISKEISLRKKLAQIIEQNSTAYGRFKTLIKGINAVQDGISKGFSTFVQRLKSAAVTYRIIGGVIRQVWSKLSSMFEEAAAYTESVNLYTIALGEYAEQGTKWANKISKALYLDPKDIMQYTGAFYNLVQGLGVASDKAYTMSTNLTQLTYDMSSYLNIDVESAQAKIQSAITGQSRAVASAGIAMQVASLQELAYSMGIQKTVANMTQAEKTYLRYIQIMRSTTNMQGDLARTIITPANAVRVLKNQFTLLTRAIGNVFIPIIMKAIPYVMALTKLLQDLATRIASFLGVKIGWSSSEIDYSGLVTLDTYLEDTGDTATGTANSVSKAVKKIEDELGNLASFDELNVITFNDDTTSGSGGTGGIGGVGGSVLPQLEEAISGYDMLSGLTSQFDKQVQNATENLDKVYSVLKKIGAIWVAWKSLSLIGNAIKLVDMIKKGSSELGGLGTIISLLYRTIKGGKGTLSETAKEIGKVSKSTKETVVATSKLKTILPSILTFTGGLVLSLSSMALEYKNVNKQTLEYLKTGKEMSALVPTLGVAGATAGGALAGSIFGPVGTLIGGTIGAIGSMSLAWDSATNAIRRYNTEAQIFGTMHIDIEAWTSILDNIFSSSNSAYNAMQNINVSMQSNYESIEKALESLDILSYKYGVVGNKISNEDAVKIMNTLQQTTTDSITLIDDSTSKSLMLWQNMLDNNNTLSKEAGEKLLSIIIDYSNRRKNEISTAEDNITKTWENAINTRGYLTEKERLYIQEQLSKIRSIVNEQMTKTEADIIHQTYQFNNDKQKLDKESYGVFLSLLDDYSKEQKTKRDEMYLQALNDAKLHYKEDSIEYKNAIKLAEEEYARSERETNTKMNEMKKNVLKKIGEMYVELLEKTDNESQIARNNLENIFKDLKIDKQWIIDNFADAGSIAYKSTQERFQDLFNKNKTYVTLPVYADTTSAVDTINKLLENASKNNIIGPTQKLPTQKMTVKEFANLHGANLKAGGGYVDSGDYFLANENGVPEYITSIGNKSAVVNQQQMVTALTNAIVEGLSNMNTPQSNEPVNIYIGNDKVYSGFINYAKRQNNIYGTNVIRV